MLFVVVVVVSFGRGQMSAGTAPVDKSKLWKGVKLAKVPRLSTKVSFGRAEMSWSTAPVDKSRLWKGRNELEYRA